MNFEKFSVQLIIEWEWHTTESILDCFFLVSCIYKQKKQKIKYAKQNPILCKNRDAKYLLRIITEWEKHWTRYYLNLRSGAVTLSLSLSLQVFWESLHILRKGRRKEIYIFVKNCYYPEIGIYLVDFYANIYVYKTSLISYENHLSLSFIQFHKWKKTFFTHIQKFFFTQQLWKQFFCE